MLLLQAPAATRSQSRIPDHLNEPRCRSYTPHRGAGRKKRQSAGLDDPHLPGGSLLDLDEQRRELIRCENYAVAVTSPEGFAGISVKGYHRDRGPGFDL